MMYKEMEHYESAITELIKSSQLAPDIINPYEELGNIYLDQFNDFEKAKSYYIRGIEAAPNATKRVEMLRWVIQDLECHK